MKLENFYIEIKSKEHSKAVQERLIGIGFRWVNSGLEILGEDIGIIFSSNTTDNEIFLTCKKESNQTRSRTKLTLGDLYEKPKETVEKTWYQVRYHCKGSSTPVMDIRYHESAEDFMKYFNSKESSYHWIELINPITKTYENE